MATIERAEREVQSAIERVRRCAEPKGASTLAAVEEELWSALLHLGRVVTALFLARFAARPRPATYLHDGQRFALDAATRRRSEIEALRQWVAEQQTKLREGKVAQMLDDLAVAHNGIPKTGPGNKGRRTRLLDIIEYLAEHEHRMPYAELRRDDLDIGTGAVEGAVRNLVGLRLDGPGMRWGRDRAEMVLHLRCIVLNRQWDDFCHYLEQRPLRLAAKPQPARTHDAKPQQSREAA